MSITITTAHHLTRCKRSVVVTEIPGSIEDVVKALRKYQGGTSESCIKKGNKQVVAVRIDDAASDEDIIEAITKVISFQSSDLARAAANNAALPASKRRVLVSADSAIKAGDLIQSGTPGVLDGAALDIPMEIGSFGKVFARGGRSVRYAYAK